MPPVPESLRPPFHWVASHPLVGPAASQQDRFDSVKDPSIVRFGGRWHLFCTVRGRRRTHQIEYLTFPDWRRVGRAQRRMLGIHDGFYCAPQVFYFSAHKKWYLICQASDDAWRPKYQAAYATATDLADAHAWSRLSPLGHRPADGKMGLDFWVICDTAKAHLFFTTLDGRLWREETRLEDFPGGWSEPVLALRGDIFEASHIYRVKGSDLYLALIEAQAGGRRYFKAYVARRLEGPWRPLAASRRQPFAARSNVAFRRERWSDSVSHGELLRAGYDERLVVDPKNLRFLFQGVSDPERKGKPYGRIPWRLGLLVRAEPRAAGPPNGPCGTPWGREARHGGCIMASTRWKAGGGVTVITPPLGSSLAGSFTDRKAVDVHDDLTAKAVVLERGDRRVALVVCDLICAPRRPLDDAKRLIQERCAIAPDHVMISCTHTHTGPATTGLLGAPPVEGYWDFAVPRIADAVQIACRRLRPAEIGFGAGSEPRCVFNRRFRMKDGSVRMNPGRLNPDIVEPAGPTDPEVGVLCIREAGTRRILAVVANYALHYVGGGDERAVSADYFGCFGRALQHILGGRFVAIMANGCCGDVNNINVGEKPPALPPYEQMERVARVLAAEVARVVHFMSFSDDGPLEVANAFVTAGVRRPSPEQLAEDRRRIEADDFPNERERLYARERLLVAGEPPEIAAQVQAMRLGDLALVAWPGEMFCRLGLDLKARSPAPTTLVVELANDYIGYVPTRRAFEEGGYETWLARSAKVAAGTGEAMVECGAGLLARLFPERGAATG